MPSMSFTKTRCVAAQNADHAKRTLYHDKTIPGFGFVAQPSGRSSWFVRYTSPNGRDRRLTLGDAARISLEDARLLARDAFVTVAAGDDPANDRAARRDVVTVAEAFEQYLEHCAPSKSRADYRRQVEKDIVPRIGNRPVDSIRRADVLKIRTTVSKRGLVVANRLIALLSAAYNKFESDLGLVPEGFPNPAARIKRHKEQPRVRNLDQDGIREIGEKLRSVLAGPECLDRESAAALQVQLLLGCRIGEVLGLRGRDIGEATVRVTGKTGPREVFVAPEVMALLRSRTTRPAGLLFHCDADRPGARYNRTLRFAKSIGLEGTHIARHTFATQALSEHGLSISVVGELLGHARGSEATEVYAHLRRNVAQEATEEVQRGLLELLNA